MTELVGPGRAVAAEKDAREARLWLLLSGAFLAVQLGINQYGTPAPMTWMLIGLVLLWLVDRHRSRVARGFLVIPAFVGAIGCAVAALNDPALLLQVAFFLGQGLPLMTGAVRRHVQGQAAPEALASSS